MATALLTTLNVLTGGLFSSKRKSVTSAADASPDWPSDHSGNTPLARQEAVDPHGAKVLDFSQAGLGAGIGYHEPTLPYTTTPVRQVPDGVAGGDASSPLAHAQAGLIYAQDLGGQGTRQATDWIVKISERCPSRRDEFRIFEEWLYKLAHRRQTAWVLAQFDPCLRAMGLPAGVTIHPPADAGQRCRDQSEIFHILHHTCRDVMFTICTQASAWTATSGTDLWAMIYKDRRLSAASVDTANAKRAELRRHLTAFQEGDDFDAWANTLLNLHRDLAVMNIPPDEDGDLATVQYHLMTLESWNVEVRAWSVAQHKFSTFMGLARAHAETMKLRPTVTSGMQASIQKPPTSAPTKTTELEECAFCGGFKHNQDQCHKYRKFQEQARRQVIERRQAKKDDSGRRGNRPPGDRAPPKCEICSQQHLTATCPEFALAAPAEAASVEKEESSPASSPSVTDDSASPGSAKHVSFADPDQEEFLDAAFEQEWMEPIPALPTEDSTSATSTGVPTSVSSNKDESSYSEFQDAPLYGSSRTRHRNRLRRLQRKRGKPSPLVVAQAGEATDLQPDLLTVRFMADSGANRGMKPSRHGVQNLRDSKYRIAVARKGRPIMGVQEGDFAGILKLPNGQYHHLPRLNMLVSEELGSSANLFSISQLADLGYKFIFSKAKSGMITPGGEFIPFLQDNGLYYLEVLTRRDQLKQSYMAKISRPRQYTATEKQNNTYNWHLALGHADPEDISLLSKDHPEMGEVHASHPCDCEVCVRAKAKLPPSPTGPGERPLGYLDSVAVDLTGDFKMKGFKVNAHGKTHKLFECWMVLVDKATRKGWVYPLISKSDAQRAIEQFCIDVGTPKELCMDGGKELINKTFKEYLRTEQISAKISIPYNKDLNACAEKRIQDLKRIVRTMLLTSGGDRSLWPFAVRYAQAIKNILPNRSNPGRQSPHSMAGGGKLNLQQFHPFGCQATISLNYTQLAGHNSFPDRMTLEPPSITGIFIGFADFWDKQSGWAVFDPKTGKVYTSTWVRFNPNYFPLRPTGTQYYHPEIMDWTPLPSGFDPFHEEASVDDVFEPSKVDTDDLQPSLQSVTQDAPTSSETLQLLTDRILQNLQADKQGDAFTARAYAVRAATVLKDNHEDVTSPVPSYTTLPPARRAQVFAAVVDILRTARTRSQIDWASTGVYEADDLILALNAIIKKPKTFKECMGTPEWKDWLGAIKKEIVDLKANNQWEDVSDLPPGKKPLPTILVFDRKTDEAGRLEKHKARLCVLGSREKKGVDYDLVFAPVADEAVIRLMFAWAFSRGMQTNHVDVRQAFTRAPPLHETFITLPHQVDVNPKQPKRLLKNLYGTHDAALAYHLLFCQIMRDLNFTEISNGNKCVFLRGEGRDLLCIVKYVDEMQVHHFSDSGAYAAWLTEFNDKLPCEDKGRVTYFLGVHYDYDDAAGTVELKQTAYIQQLARDFEVDKTFPHPVSNVIEAGKHLTKDDCPETPLLELGSKHRSLAASLLYISRWTRPEAMWATTEVCRFMANPAASHYKDALQILKFLSQTANEGIMYYRQCEHTEDNHLTGFKPAHDIEQLLGLSDSDWGGCIDTRVSTSGNCFFYKGMLVAWKVERQKGKPAQSACEAEYRSLTPACEFADSFRFILRNLPDTNFDRPVPILEDNESTILMSYNPMNRPKLRHIDMRRHWCRQAVEDKDVELRHIGTDHMVADIFTKSLSNVLFDRHRRYLLKGLERTNHPYRKARRMATGGALDGVKPKYRLDRPSESDK